MDKPPRPECGTNDLFGCELRSELNGTRRVVKVRAISFDRCYYADALGKTDLGAWASWGVSSEGFDRFWDPEKLKMVCNLEDVATNATEQTLSTVGDDEQRWLECFDETSGVGGTGTWYLQNVEGARANVSSTKS